MSVFLVTPGLPTSKLNIIIVLLFLLAFAGLIVWLTAGAGADNENG